MNRLARPLVMSSIAALALVGLGATPATAAELPADDRMYALSCPQGNNPLFPDAMQLWSVDASTVVGSPLGAGSGDVEGTCAGQPAWDPVTRAAYAFALTDDHDEPSVLMRIDLATGASTPLAAMYYNDEPVQVASLAIGSDGSAYALAYTQLYSIDLETGELDPIGGELPLSYGFAVDPTTGIFWALTAGSSLLQIDVSTGSYTFGQSLELAGAYSLQFDSAGGMWVFAVNVDDNPVLHTELWTAKFGASEPSTSVGVLSVVDEGEPFSQALLIVPSAFAAEPPATAPAPTTLAATGFQPGAALGAAGILVLIGFAAIAVGRRPA